MSQTKKDKLAELEAKLFVAQEATSKIVADLRKLRSEIWSDESGINTDDRVLFMDGKVQRTGVVVKINASSNFVHPIIRVDKKDGTPGQREVRCYDKNLKKI